MRRQTRSALIKLLAFAVLSSLLTAVVLATLLNLDVNPQHGYSAEFVNASGIETGDDVRIAGVQVGKVSSVRLVDRHARIGFTVDTDQHLTTSSMVAVHYANLLGQRFLAIEPGAPGGAPLHPGSDIPMNRTVPGLDLTQVFDGFQPLFAALTPTEVNQLTSSIVQVFEGESGTVGNLLSQTATVTNNLAGQQQAVDELLDNLASLLNVVGTHDSQISGLIDNFDSLVRSVAGSRSQLGGAIDGLASLTNTLAGELGQSQPSINQDIDQLASTTGTLSTEQNQVGALLQGLPGVFNTAAKVVSTGDYMNVYICNLSIDIQPVASAADNTAGPLNVSIIPGVSAPQYPDPLYLPANSTTGGTTHTAACQ